MEKIKDLVLKYRENTMALIISLEGEAYEEMEQSLRERQKIIDLLESNHDDYPKELIVEEFQKTDVLELDRKANELLLKEFSKVKEKLRLLDNSKFIKDKYGRHFSNPIFFNKKI